MFLTANHCPMKQIFIHFAQLQTALQNLTWDNQPTIAVLILIPEITGLGTGMLTLRTA